MKMKKYSVLILMLLVTLLLLQISLIVVNNRKDINYQKLPKEIVNLDIKDKQKDIGAVLGILSNDIKDAKIIKIVNNAGGTDVTLNLNTGFDRLITVMKSLESNHIKVSRCEIKYNQNSLSCIMILHCEGSKL